MYIDDGVIVGVIELYCEYFLKGGCFLDFMSFWVSYLLEDVVYEEVVGYGMNVEELVVNLCFFKWFVQNLNQIFELLFEDNCFDGVMVCVFVQYLI